MIHTLQYAGKPIAILPIVAACREKMPAWRMKAFPQAIIRFETEIFRVALGAFPFRTRANADAEIFEQDLGDCPRCHACPPHRSRIPLMVTAISWARAVAGCVCHLSGCASFNRVVSTDARSTGSSTRVDWNAPGLPPK